MPIREFWFAIAGTAALLAVGCVESKSRQATAATGGDPAAGKADVKRYGCGSCHTIPGVPGANAKVGPPLTGVGARQYIAGELANSPGNLIHWIQHPHAVNEKTLMPELGVTEQDARDISALLYSLK